MFAQGARAVTRDHFAPVIPAIDALEKPQIETITRKTVAIGPGHRPKGAAHRNLAGDPQSDQLHYRFAADRIGSETMRHAGSDALPPFHLLGSSHALGMTRDRPIRDNPVETDIFRSIFSRARSNQHQQHRAPFRRRPSVRLVH